MSYGSEKRKHVNYQLLVLDLDGTLTNNEKIITPRTLRALEKFQVRGGKVVLASGRPTYGIVPLAEEIALKRHGGYILAFNGARIIEASTGRTVFDQLLEAENIVPLYDAAMRHGMQILTYQGEGIIATDINDAYVREEAMINKMPLTKVDNFVASVVEPINKCLIVGDPEKLAVVCEELSAALSGKMNIYRSAPYFLECVPLGVDKAESLSKLLPLVGCEREEVVAVGDGYNDISMIKFAGLGVAMENAAEEVKDAADLITYSNEEDGVAHLIEKLML